ncbi:MAG: ROK family protein [Anaerolineae bacterium]
MNEVLIAVDLGGTRIRAARLSSIFDIQLRREILTEANKGLESTLSRMKDLVRSVWPDDDSKVVGIGISSPGPLNPNTGVIVMAANLPGWHNVPLAQILQDEFEVPVYLGNDANVAALAETVLGAAKGFRHVIYITVSTGIGTGMIIDGKMLLGAAGLGAEGGHIIMIAGDKVSSLELETAGPALAQRARRQIEAGATTAITEMVKGDLSQISGAVVGQAAQQGDKLAQEVVQYAGRVLGLGMVTFLHLFNPEMVVIGGSVAMNLGEMLFAPMRAAIQQHTQDDSYWRELRIEPAALGDNVGIFGAASLVATEGGHMDVAETAARLGH